MTDGDGRDPHRLLTHANWLPMGNMEKAEAEAERLAALESDADLSDEERASLLVGRLFGQRRKLGGSLDY